MLGHNALVVDVGGGVGSRSLVLAQTFPDLRIVVQDQESVTKLAAEVLFPDGRGDTVLIPIVLRQEASG
jgi:hypothetical protein